MNVKTQLIDLGSSVVRVNAELREHNTYMYLVFMSPGQETEHYVVPAESFHVSLDDKKRKLLIEALGGTVPGEPPAR